MASQATGSLSSHTESDPVCLCKSLTAQGGFSRWTGVEPATPLTQISYPWHMPRKRKPISQAEQSRRFEEVAREAGVDTRPETLERIIRRIAKTPPMPKPKAPRKK